MRMNWGHGIATVYAIFAAATVWFVMFAVGHPAELVSADYYAQSLAHDGRQAAAGRAAAVAGQISARVREDGQALVVSLPSIGGAERARGNVRLYRPARANDDRAWPLALDAQGHQTVLTAGLPSGRWIMQLDWRIDDVDFYAERPVMLP